MLRLYRLTVEMELLVSELRSVLFAPNVLGKILTSAEDEIKSFDILALYSTSLFLSQRLAIYSTLLFLCLAKHNTLFFLYHSLASDLLKRGSQNVFFLFI